MERALYEPGHGYYRRPDAGPGSRRRLPHGPGAAPDLRRGDRAAARAGLGGDRAGRTRSSSPSPAPERAPSPPACSAGCGTPGRRSSPRSGTARSSARHARLAALRDRLAADGLAGHLADDAPADGHGSRPAPSSRTRSSTRCRSTASSGGPDGLRERFVGVDGDRLRLGRGRAEHARARGAPRRRGRRARRRPGHGGLPRHRRLAGRRRRPTSPAAPVVLVDYADEPAALHSTARPRRHAAGVRAPRRRRRPAPPRRAPGPDRDRRPRRRPRRGGRAAGLEPVGETTQAELLAASGRPRVGVAAAGPAPRSRTRCSCARRSPRLLDPRGMGGFRVLVFGRGMPAGRRASGPPPHRSLRARAAPPGSSRRARHRC